MNIFILCGAHDGSVVRKIDQVTNSGLYGPDIRWDTIHLFEPQPFHTQNLKTLCSRDTRCVYHPAGVSNVAGTFEFFVKGDIGNCSSTLDPYKATGQLKQVITVEVVDFVEWLRENTSPTDSVVIDMDIECEEYKVLPALISSEIVDRIKWISVEFHQNKSTYWKKDSKDILIEQEVRKFFSHRFLDHNTYFG